MDDRFKTKKAEIPREIAEQIEKWRKEKHPGATTEEIMGTLIQIGWAEITTK